MTDSAALEVAKKQQQDFLASIAHELRTPLNGIIGLSDALFKSEQNKGRSKHLKMIFSCANRLVGLVNMIMDITALRDGKLNLSVTENMNFNEILEEVQELMINAVDKNGKKIKKDSVELQIDIDPALPTMQGDRERLTQIVYNLVNNALKFTDAGFVKMSTKYDQGTLLFCCSDSGKGIKKENFKKIFEAFGQEEEGKGGGLGLGLAIVTKILDLHGGKIWVESELGKGAQFWVRCPLKMDPNAVAAIKAEAEAKQALAEASASGGAVGAVVDNGHHAASHSEADNRSLVEEARNKLKESTVKILLIDGDQARVDQMRKILTSHPERPNSTIMTALDGMKGLQQIDSASLPDLVIIDADTPGGMSAFDVITTLRSEQAPDLNIMVVCPAGDTSKHLRASQSLATSIIHRPISDDLLSSTVHEALIVQAMVRMDRENKIGSEMLTRLLPAAIVAKIGKSGTPGIGLAAENYKQLTIMTMQIREFDQIVALIPITQVAVLLNRIQSAIDGSLGQFDVVRLDAVANCGEFVVMCGHDRQEDHIDKVMGFAKKILSAVGNGNLKIAGHAVELLIGVHSAPAVACVVTGDSSKSSSPRFLVFGEAADLSRRLCITGVANYLHVSKCVADKMNEDYEGSGLFDFTERGVLGDGDFAVSTYVLKASSEENVDLLKSATLNSTLTQFIEGSGPGSCAGSANIKDQLEDYEKKVQLMEMRISIMKGLDDAANLAMKQLEASVLKTGLVPAAALLAIADPVEQTLHALENFLGSSSDPPPQAYQVIVGEFSRLEAEAESLVDEIDQIQKTAREAKKQVHQAIATAAIGARSGKQIGLSEQAAESMGIVLSEMADMIDEVDKKLADGGYPPPSVTNGDLSKIVTDLTMEVESISTNIDRAIRFYSDNQSISGSDLAQLKAMGEQVQSLKLELGKKDAQLAGMPINGGIPKDEAIAMLQELMGVQQECRTLHLEIEWYQEKIAELSGTNSKLLEDNRLLANDIREAKNILDEQERTIRHQQLQLSQASSMSEFAAPSVSGYYRPYTTGGVSARGMSLPPNRLGLLRAPGPGAGSGLQHWAQIAGFNFGQGFNSGAGGVML